MCEQAISCEKVCEHVKNIISKKTKLEHIQYAIVYLFYLRWKYSNWKKSAREEISSLGLAWRGPPP